MKTVRSEGKLDYNSNVSINCKSAKLVQNKENEETIDEDGEMVSFSPLFRQVFASSGPLIVTIASGMTSGYSAILLPQLAEANSTIRPTKQMESWIASMAPLPMALGCILGGILMERYGRRMAHIITCFPYIIGWACLALAVNIEMILVGRFLTGICVGLLGPPSSVYIAEIAEPRYRGFLLAGVSLAIASGLMFSHLLGTFFSWQLTAVICGICPVLCLLLIYAVPESPSWLTNQNRHMEAKAAFLWCRGTDPHNRQELTDLLERSTKITQTTKLSFSETLENIRKPEFLKPLFILSLFFLTVQWAGNNAVAFYSVSIMQQTVQHVDKYVAMLAIDGIRTGMSIIACILLKKCGRRPLTMISGFGTAASLGVLGLYLHLSPIYKDLLAPYSFIPLVALASYIVFISIGLVPLPWAMTGELFPLKLKGLGSGFTTCLNFLAFFFVVKTSPDMFEALGTGGAFLTYGAIALVGAIVLCFVLPETKDKTLQDIERQFRCDDAL